jgi:hypothetical protein
VAKEESTLALLGREIAPHPIDGQISTLEYRLEKTATPTVSPLPIPSRVSTNGSSSKWKRARYRSRRRELRIYLERR